jgi:hypothetical protein
MIDYRVGGNAITEEQLFISSLEGNDLIITFYAF